MNSDIDDDGDDDDDNDGDDDTCCDTSVSNAVNLFVRCCCHQNELVNEHKY